MKIIIDRDPFDECLNTIYIKSGNWDDYDFKTTFHVIFFNSKGEMLNLGDVKIGYKNQEIGRTVIALRKNLEELPGKNLEELPGKNLEELPDDWFSLGQDVEYYKNVYDQLSENERSLFLMKLRDVVSDNKRFFKFKGEEVFQKSLMRNVSQTVIFGQFKRVLNEQPALTDFKFRYCYPAGNKNSRNDLIFNVIPDSKPSTNIHVLIGRNGVGKTTLLNNIAKIITSSCEIELNCGKLYDNANRHSSNDCFLPSDYFSRVVSISFSMFDQFVLSESKNPDVKYYYVGMKEAKLDTFDKEVVTTKSKDQLAEEFLESLQSCLSQEPKKQRWCEAISSLESDSNFAEMSLKDLVESKEFDSSLAEQLFQKMSSGHAAVLLTITQLVDTVEEKTLVLMDEPESHLHPPLLSAFVRALSDLLHNRNGVAIIATHSPVVVQEVPKSCVWKLTRFGEETRVDRPECQTFGENIGVLTREIFGLEVSKSGFHNLLEKAVEDGGSFESISQEYHGQLGFEAQAILRTLITIRDNARVN
ncbi:AAA family ATPase [Neisseriaceae bacterium TC5R-5]|nr:AAA family ATPase [Neisseriaceae bacterium TC5R-5]